MKKNSYPWGFSNDIQLFHIAKITLWVAFMELHQRQYIQDTEESSKNYQK